MKPPSNYERIALDIDGKLPECRTRLLQLKMKEDDRKVVAQMLRLAYVTGVQDACSDPVGIKAWLMSHGFKVRMKKKHANAD